MASASRLIESADELRVVANQTIQQSHELRQTIQKNRKMDVPAIFLNQQLEHSKALQLLGSQLRQQAQDLTDQAMDLLKLGMVAEYEKWIGHTEPFQLAMHTVNDMGAHNAAARSLHPKMEALTPKPFTHQADNMSIALTSMAPQQLPPNLDLSPFQLSRNKAYFAYVGVEPDESDSARYLVKLNTIQSWRLLLTNLQGEPIENAQIRFKGTMPGHVHGLPTQPRVTEEIAPGVYRISGVKFQMRGWWVIDLIVEPNESHSKNEDVLRFNLHL